MVVLAIITQGAALWLAYKIGQKSPSGLASQDELTGLPNRRALYRRRLEANKPGFWAALLLDLNGFKPVNDDLGHDAGDELLKVIARRLRAVVSTGQVYRLGGDEFVIVVGPFRSIEAAEQSALKLTTQITQVIAEPISLGEKVVKVTASVGIAGGVLSRALLRNADVAMYQAKDLSRTGTPQPSAVLFRPDVTILETVTPEEPSGQRRDRRFRKR